MDTPYVFKKLSNAFNNLFFVFGTAIYGILSSLYTHFVLIFLLYLVCLVEKIVGVFKKGWGVLGVYFFGGAAG
jgi:hypothetical protein